ncbi:restriction endonuclease subunit S [uncultured Duncaniella sp.]|uniref:restriction endonuclease subunit S n=1 Tax=uncultured Duncaniella sp. TaxID=2768039 RepID=UPI0025B6657D|nr:restriction endonuclease subunit S [uncultured Duncaniella sp.]
MTQSKEIKWVKIGDFIVVSDETNSRNLDLPVMGLNKDKQMMPTVANLDGVNLSKYKIVDKGTFVFSGMQTGRDICIRIVLANNEKSVLVSPAYTTFLVNPIKKILPEYLFLWFNRDEADRYGWFISDSSIRSNLDWPRFLNIQIPVPFKDGEPDVERQKDVVNIWQGLRRLKEENEAIAQPLLELCQAKMDELKQSAPMVELGEYIEQHDVRNTDNNLKIESVRGLATSKEIISTKANMEGVSLTSYKIMRPLDIAYVADTSRRGDKVSLAHNQSTDCYLLSSISTVFTSSDFDEFDPTYLFLWFCRPEFDRYARFNSWGSARETFSWTEMCRVKVPKPSIDVQRAIVDIYHCARRAKDIAEEASQQLKSICPALMQYIIHSAV